MLEGVETTSKQTIWVVTQIRDLMLNYKRRIRAELPKIYSQDLLANLFRHPYTTIDSLKSDLNVGRVTAAKYLNKLVQQGFLKKLKRGRRNFYINEPLMQVFTSQSPPSKPAV